MDPLVLSKSCILTVNDVISRTFELHGFLGTFMLITGLCGRNFCIVIFNLPTPIVLLEDRFCWKIAFVDGFVVFLKCILAIVLFFTFTGIQVCSDTFVLK